MSDQPYEQTDSSDPGSEGLAGDGVSAQLTQQDTLDDRGVKDVLDEGYSPPDRDPGIDVPTPAEEAAGESIAQRLSEEVPDVGAEPEPDRASVDPGADGEVDSTFEVGDRRAGRLADPDADGIRDVQKDLVASDAGIDGAGASAEEAAVHVYDGEPDENTYPDGRPVDD